MLKLLKNAPNLTYEIPQPGPTFLFLPTVGVTNNRDFILLYRTKKKRIPLEAPEAPTNHLRGQVNHSSKCPATRVPIHSQTITRRQVSLELRQSTVYWWSLSGQGGATVTIAQ